MENEETIRMRPNPSGKVETEAPPEPGGEQLNCIFTFDGNEGKELAREVAAAAEGYRSQNGQRQMPSEQAEHSLKSHQLMQKGRNIEQQ